MLGQRGARIALGNRQGVTGVPFSRVMKNELSRFMKEGRGFQEWNENDNVYRLCTGTPVCQSL
jgi:hypothetical protein